LASEVVDGHSGNENRPDHDVVVLRGDRRDDQSVVDDREQERAERHSGD
jgi:hypothetical protein